MRYSTLLLSTALVACGGQRRDPEPPPPIEPIEPVPAPMTITGAGGTAIMGATGEPQAPAAVAQAGESYGRASLAGSGGISTAANSESETPHRDTTNAATGNAVTGTSMVTVTASVTSAGNIPRIY